MANNWNIPAWLEKEIKNVFIVVQSLHLQKSQKKQLQAGNILSMMQR